MAIIHHSTLPEPALRQLLYYPIYTHADGLAVGLLLAWVSTFHKEQLRSVRFTLLASFAMLAGGVILYLVSRLLFSFTALGLIYGAFTLYGISVLPIPRLLTARIFYIISRLSFGIYLNHFGVLEKLYGPLHTLADHGQLGFWCSYVVALGVSIAIATMSFLGIEWPFLQIRAQWLDHERKTPRVGSSSAAGELPHRPLGPENVTARPS